MPFFLCGKRVKSLSKKGFPPEDISNLLEIDLEKVLEILKS